MAYKIQIADSAKAELREIVGYIAEMLANPTAAASLLEDFEKQKTFLVENPRTFPFCPIQSLQKRGYRRFIFKQNYLALYLVDDDEKIVTIMHIFYARRDYEKLV
ncbi:MAG: type II toxin-antitoxin system RelE/ParE family toxin [Treponema sp.]|nr:type II toxin-antitoxin system RelE/ParE family toxin [Treponema sp.]